MRSVIIVLDLVETLADEIRKQFPGSVYVNNVDDANLAAVVQW